MEMPALRFGAFWAQRCSAGLFMAFRRHSRLLSNVSPSPTIPRLTVLILLCISSSRKCLTMWSSQTCTRLMPKQSIQSWQNAKMYWFNHLTMNWYNLNISINSIVSLSTYMSTDSINSQEYLKLFNQINQPIYCWPFSENLWFTLPSFLIFWVN